MSFFSKGRHKHANSGNEVFSFATQRTEESAEKKQENVSGALTPEEIAGVLPQETSGEGSALESLQKRMLDARQSGKKAAEILLEQNENIQEDPSDLPDAETARENAMSDAEAELPEPATGTEAVAATNSDEISEPSAAENEKTLLEKCRPFILDENGRDLTVNEEPAYHLQSVAELLKANSEETISRLSRDYGVIWEEIDPLKTEEKTEQETEKSTQTVPQEPNGQTIPVVSDFESNPVSQPTVSQQTATIKFTPVTDVYSSSRMSVSTQTKNIDLTGELADFADEPVEEEPVTRLEETEFDEFSPPEEFTAPSDAKHFLRKFSLKKRSAFLRAVCSVWLAVLTAVLELPLFSDLLLSRTRPVMAVCTAFFAANVLVNVRMFGSIRYLFSRRATADIAAVLASVTTLVYAVYGTVSGEIVLELLVLMSVSLAVRALMAFYHDSTML
ncbi:MAG: hypothetical protein IJT66_01160, partial [Clostridia bacterium]|nr:hypothetical protein [Clostridia bacterium]